MQNEITNSIQIAKEQNNFLETTIGKLINTGINTGLRVLLPDLIEDQIISIKDEIIKNGFKAGMQQTVSSAIELGKSVVGMVTGKFDNINQAQTVIKSGGLIDTVSSLLDKGINTTIKNNIISTNVGKVIKRGKNTILNNVANNITMFKHMFEKTQQDTSDKDSFNNAMLIGLSNNNLLDAPLQYKDAVNEDINQYVMWLNKLYGSGLAIKYNVETIKENITN